MPHGHGAACSLLCWQKENGFQISFFHNMQTVGGRRAGDGREQGGDGRGAGVSDPSWVPLPGLIVFSLTNSGASCTSAGGPPPPRQEAPSHPSRILLLNQCLSPPQITRPPTGFTLAPHGRSGARIQSIRRWNWRKSFCSTCISRGTAGTRWPGCSTSPRGR